MLSNLGDFIAFVKTDINKFAERLNISPTSSMYSEKISIIKQYYFIKSILEKDFDKHYIREMNYDILMTIHCLMTQSSLRNFHYNFRSLNENLVRVTLNLEDADETGVNELFRQFKRYSSDKNFQNMYDIITNEYGHSCFYVHSNMKSKAQFIEFLSELEKFDDLSSEEQKLITALSKVLETFIKILIENRTRVIFETYTRRLSLIDYLITKSNYQFLLSKQE